jgi:hypothetical protein
VIDMESKLIYDLLDRYGFICTKRNYYGIMLMEEYFTNSNFYVEYYPVRNIMFIESNKTNVRMYLDCENSTVNVLDLIFDKGISNW